MEGGSAEYRKRLWTVEEDRILMDYIRLHGKGKWSRVAKVTGLKRCGKSCRLRWINYLSPSVKRGDFSQEEDDLIIRLHKLLGNRWSLIAGRVPGRTDNQVKNHWNTQLSKKLGVKKEKCKVSAPPRFSREVGANFHNPSSLSANNAPLPNGNDGATNQNVIDGDSKNVLEINNTTQGLMIATDKNMMKNDPRDAMEINNTTQRLMIAADKNVIENDSRGPVEINNTTQSLMMSDCYEDSFWFSYDESFAPNLLEQLDESYDFFWNVF